MEDLVEQASHWLNIGDYMVPLQPPIDVTGDMILNINHTK